MPQLQGHRLALERSRRPQRDSEQGRAEEKDQRRAAESTNRPDRISKGAAFATESERKLAGAKRERRQCRDGDASAYSHGESCRHASPEDPCVSAKTSTRIAPVHGLTPTENTTARIFRHENGPASSRASTMWWQASPSAWLWP